MSTQSQHSSNRRNLLNIGAISLLGLAFPAGMREEFSLLAEHNANRNKPYPLTDTIIKTDSGAEIRLIGVLHTKRGLIRGRDHIEKAVNNSDIILSENTDLVGAELEYFNDLAKFALKQGKQVIDVDRFSKGFRDWLDYTYVGATFLHCFSAAAPSYFRSVNKQSLAKASEIAQPILFTTAALGLLGTHYSPVRNYCPAELDLSFDATARSIAMYMNSLKIIEQSVDQKVTLICGEGHARDIIRFKSQSLKPEESKLLALYGKFLQEPLKLNQ
jgi:hypothetical protein